MAAIYLISDMGSIGGGWLSSQADRHAGRSVNFARKATMLLCAVLIMPIWFAQDVSSPSGVRCC